MEECFPLGDRPGLPADLWRPSGGTHGDPRRQAGLSGASSRQMVRSEKEDMDDPAAYWYPKEPGRQVMGRANLPGSPVFYSCGSAGNSINEAASSRAAGQQLFRSEWRFTDHDPWKMACMLPPDRITEDGRPFINDWEEGLRHYIMAGGTAPPDHLLLLYTCVTELFMRDEYEVTSWIAHEIMQETGQAPMLIYPSLQADETDLCHAISTGPVDAGRVVLDKVVAMVEKDGMPIAGVEGHPVEGRIVWNTPVE
jgi:hypothetical protein